MNFIIILVLMNNIHSQIVSRLPSTCRCSQILSQQDCNQHCLWNKAQQICQDLRCSNTLDQSICSNASGCMFVNEKCVEFTKCEDLTLKSDCTIKYASICHLDSNQLCITTSTALQSQPIICSNILPGDCNFQTETSTGNICANINGTCISVKADTCSGINNVISSMIRLLCDFKDNCVYQESTSKCVSKKCKDLQQTDCDFNNYQLEYDEVSAQLLCTWTSQCDEGYNISALNQSNCYQQNLSYQLTWDENLNLCTLCPGFGNKVYSIGLLILTLIY